LFPFLFLYFLFSLQEGRSGILRLVDGIITLAGRNESNMPIRLSKIRGRKVMRAQQIQNPMHCRNTFKIALITVKGEW
jgi:hypothetical protein